MEPHSDDVLLCSDVAKAGLVTSATVQNWHKRGWLPAMVTVGGRRLFRRADVDAFLTARRARGEAAK